MGEREVRIVTSNFAFVYLLIKYFPLSSFDTIEIREMSTETIYEVYRDGLLAGHMKRNAIRIPY